MNLITEIPSHSCDGLSLTSIPEGLSAIREPDCSAMIWQRSPLASFQSWIDELAPEQLPKARTIVSPEKMREAVMHVCDICETPAGPERDMLIDDVAALANIFAELMQAPYLLLRLDVISSNACRKFHTDTVTARLICTYRGTGTQYGIAGDGAEPERVFTAPTAAPIVLRGKNWPTIPQTGFVHRSPPIEGTGETRLVLVLDPVLDLEDASDGHFVH
ncbi:MAG: DUF1826 domain-containing protein [Pseudomonadota bacterium]